MEIIIKLDDGREFILQGNGEYINYIEDINTYYKLAKEAKKKDSPEILRALKTMEMIVLPRMCNLGVSDETKEKFEKYFGEDDILFRRSTLRTHETGDDNMDVESAFFSTYWIDKDDVHQDLQVGLGVIVNYYNEETEEDWTKAYWFEKGSQEMNFTVLERLVNDTRHFGLGCELGTYIYANIEDSFHDKDMDMFLGLHE